MRFLGWTTFVLLGCGDDATCREPIRDAPALFPTTWDEVTARGGCVETRAETDGERSLFIDQCETVAGALYRADGELKAAFTTDDTGQCVVHYGPGSFRTSSGQPSPGCVDDVYTDSDLPSADTPVAAASFQPSGCYGTRTCTVEADTYTVYARYTGCENHLVTLTDDEGAVVAQGPSRNPRAWTGPAALYTCVSGSYEPSPDCGFAE